LHQQETVSAKVQLQIKQNNAAGKAFCFAEHDTFIFGRMPDCHACLPDDIQVSRHHFILEVNPPQACLRDLGSLNGTIVNGKKFGGRMKSETPEEGAKRAYPEVSLKNGDVIEVGQTSLEVQIEQPEEPPKHPINPLLADISLLSPRQLARLIFGEPNTPGAGRKLNIPGYAIEEEIGRGGFGAVYRATTNNGGKPVAIKVMLARVDADDAAVQKFRREASVNAELIHPNVVKLLGQGGSGAVFYFLMEFCDGGSVADEMLKNGGRLSLAKAKPIIFDALTGLAHAHQKGFVHRDLKPQNILLAKGVARISDFGLSKNFQQAGLSGLSMTGSYAGTPVFMPKEQITNYKYVKPVSDVWSMAATIYNMLTGQFPYQFSKGRDPIDVILNDEIVPIRQRDPSFSKGLAGSLEKALSKKVKDRYQTASEMLAALREVLK
jgi:eukaryotic-like serine/threonine-protein kinase